MVELGHLQIQLSTQGLKYGQYRQGHRNRPETGTFSRNRWPAYRILQVGQRRERRSRHIEAVTLHLGDPSMPPGLRDGLGRSFNQRLELAIGAHGELLDDHVGQDALAALDLRNIVAELSQLCRQVRVPVSTPCAPRNRRAR
jgi:hypothetical protein